MRRFMSSVTVTQKQLHVCNPDFDLFIHCTAFTGYDDDTGHTDGAV